jgi:hypothetical protein
MKRTDPHQQRFVQTATELVMNEETYEYEERQYVPEGMIAGTAKPVDHPDITGREIPIPAPGPSDESPYAEFQFARDASVVRPEEGNKENIFGPPYPEAAIPTVGRSTPSPRTTSGGHRREK